MTTADVQEKLEDLSKRASYISPSECNDEAIMLSAILSSLNVPRATMKQKAYRVALDVIGSASLAEITMKASDEYKQFMILDGLSEAVLQMIHSLKAKDRNLTDEEKTI